MTTEDPTPEEDIDHEAQETDADPAPLRPDELHEGDHESEDGEAESEEQTEDSDQAEPEEPAEEATESGEPA